jgi:NAD(P)-dependent dehydrogenase (short-subunit alcohol dehydrogenase family)
MPRTDSAKRALISITQSAAGYLAPYNINVSAVLPRRRAHADVGRVSTGYEAERFGLEPGGWIRKTVESVPLEARRHPGRSGRGRRSCSSSMTPTTSPGKRSTSMAAWR